MQWIGYDEDSCGHQVYWLDKQCVSVERNVVFEGEGNISSDDNCAPTAAQDQLDNKVIIELPQENEDEMHHRTQNSDPQPQLQVPLAQSPTPQPNPLPNFKPETLDQPDDDSRCSQHIRKPSRYVQDILEGIGTGQGLRGQPALPKGVRMPHTNLEDTASATAYVVLQEMEEEEEEEAASMEEIVDWDKLIAWALSAMREDPKNDVEACLLEDWPEWDQAVKKEIKKLEEMRTWDLVEAPDGANIVGS